MTAVRASSGRSSPDQRSGYAPQLGAPRRPEARRLRDAAVGPTLVAAVLAAGTVVALLGAVAADLIVGRGVHPELGTALDVLRAAAAAVVLFLACGLAPARLLSPAALRPWSALLALPLGACLSGLALTMLGGLRVPLEVSLAILLAAGLGGALATGALGAEHRPGRDELRRLAGPVLTAAFVACVLVAPMLRAGSLATVLGGNGDAHLVTGVAELLQQAPPGVERVALPVDHMPGVWGSRYPMIYVLGATAQLSGLDPVAAFSTVCAVLMACAALGFFLLARTLLGAEGRGALLAMTLPALGTGALNVVFNPFYNLQWALVTLPLVLVAGWLHLRGPSRRSLALLSLAAVCSLLAYPLLFPFVALFLAVVAVRERRRLRERGEHPDWLAGLRLPRRTWVRIALAPFALVASLMALVLAAAAATKMVNAVGALLPGGDLTEWYTPGEPFAPVGVRFGMPEGLALGTLLVLGLAAVALRRAPRDAGVALAVLLGAMVATVGLMRLRDGTQLFYLRTLSILGPLTLALAGAGVGALLVKARNGRAVAGMLAAALTLVLVGAASGHEVRHTFPFVDRELWQVRDWGRRLPPAASVRVDPYPIAASQWAGYMLAPHPLTATDPLRKFFPHPPVGRRADFLLVNRFAQAPDRFGPPLFVNRDYALYRASPTTSGPDRSSRELVDPLEKAGASRSD